MEKPWTKKNNFFFKNADLHIRANKKMCFLKVILQIGILSCIQLDKFNGDTIPSYRKNKISEGFNEAL